MLRSLFLGIVCLTSLSVFSQQKTITEDLKSYKPGASKVQINQSPMLDLIMSNQLKDAQSRIVTEGNVSYIVSRGYRIQIFSGNNQRLAKAEATSKANKVKMEMPELLTYVTFQSPFWKLRVGNYRTSEEANAALLQLKQNFPSWKEMFIVSDIIKIPVSSLNTPY